MLDKERAKRLAHRIIANQRDEVEVSLNILGAMHSKLSEHDYKMICEETFKILDNHEKKSNGEPSRLIEWFKR